MSGLVCGKNRYVRQIWRSEQARNFETKYASRSLLQKAEGGDAADGTNKRLEKQRGQKIDLVKLHSS